MQMVKQQLFALRAVTTSPFAQWAVQPTAQLAALLLAGLD
jgi:hypothetical protein